MKEMQRHVEVVLKALDILDLFQTNTVLSLKEISQTTGMNQSRVMRLTGTLASRGYLLYDIENRQFRLGMRLFSLGSRFEDHSMIIHSSRPILHDLVKITGEMSSLYVIDGLERIALVREKGSHEITYNISERQRVELYAGAAGKVLLAFAPPEISQKVLRKTFLKRLTSNTITDPKILARELKIIRQNKFAMSEGERAPDVWSVAAPVFNNNATICCAIGIAGPSYRISKTMKDDYCRLVIEKAGELTRHLGGHDYKNIEEEK